MRALVGALDWDGDGHGDTTLGLVLGDEHGTTVASSSDESSLSLGLWDAWREGKITLLDDRLGDDDSSGRRGSDERGWKGEMTFVIGGTGLAIVGRELDASKTRLREGFHRVKVG